MFARSSTLSPRVRPLANRGGRAVIPAGAPGRSAAITAGSLPVARSSTLSLLAQGGSTVSFLRLPGKRGVHRAACAGLLRVAAPLACLVVLTGVRPGAAAGSFSLTRLNPPAAAPKGATVEA